MFAKPKRRSNDGHSSQVFNARPTLPKTLENAYLADRAKEAEARHEERNAKQAPKIKGHPARSLPDATVLALRALRQFHGWSARQLAVYFNIPDWKAHQLCAFTTMLDLVPEPQHAPHDAVKPVLSDGRGRKPKAPPPPMMAGTYRSLQEVRTRKFVDPAELRLSEKD